VWARNQQIAFEASGMTTNFRLVITSLQVDVGGESVDTEKGYVVDTTGACECVASFPDALPMGVSWDT
jgi:hypothetical protein